MYFVTFFSNMYSFSAKCKYKSTGLTMVKHSLFQATVPQCITNKDQVLGNSLLVTKYHITM